MPKVKKIGQTRIAEYESPNTVAGLVRKRDELTQIRRKLEVDLARVTSDIDHLEGAIKLFDPEATPDAAKRYATKYRSRNGHAKRFLLDRLRRAAGQPMTTLDLTHEWMTERGIPDHHATYVIIRRRIGASIVHLMRHGLVRAVETGKWRKEYVITDET